MNTSKLHENKMYAPIPGLAEAKMLKLKAKKQKRQNKIKSIAIIKLKIRPIFCREVKNRIVNGSNKTK